MTTVLAFLIALGLLIAVHEYGHYKVAVLCGVKVLKFSIGFGKTLFRWKLNGKSTEFAIGWIPLGGFVRMLDEREGVVAPQERHLAFNTQPLFKRAAIVAAGPAANLLMAILLYSMVNWGGIEEPRAVLSSPAAQSLAEKAGLRGGEVVRSVATDGGPQENVLSFDDLRWRLTQAALAGSDVELFLQTAAGQTLPPVQLRMSLLPLREADAQLFRSIGILAPWTAPVIGAVQENSAARSGGLLEGDRVLSIGDLAIVDGAQLREVIRNQVRNGVAQTKTWKIERGKQDVSLDITPQMKGEPGSLVPRIGAFVGAAPEMVTLNYGFVQGLWRGVQRTWEVSALTLKMLGRMLIGEASLKNLSGPLTIADYAGKTASAGLTQYLTFLALISVSLGVLNLLPLPVLDGGHLMYYLWEGLTGRAVSEAWLGRLQRGGVAVLVVMMCIAFFNDLTRLLG